MNPIFGAKLVHEQWKFFGKSIKQTTNCLPSGELVNSDRVKFGDYAVFLLLGRIYIFGEDKCSENFNSGKFFFMIIEPVLSGASKRV